MLAGAHSSSLWPAGLSRNLEPCSLDSLLKFRHVRVKVDCLHASLQAGVGSLKLTLVEYSSPSHIVFIFGQWQLLAVGCSSQLFTTLCQLAHNNFCPVLLVGSPCLFLTLYCFSLFLSLILLSFLLICPLRLVPCPVSSMACSLCLCLSLSIPLLHPSSSLSSSPPLNHQHHNSDKPPGCQLWFCFNNTLSDFQSHPFPQRWT